MIYAWENPKCGQNSFLRSVPYTGPHSHAEAFSPENLLVQQTGGLGFRAERCAVPPYHTPGGTSSATDLLSVKELDCLFKMVSLSRNKGMTVDSKKKKISTDFTLSDWQSAHSRAVNCFLAFQLTLLPICLFTLIWEHLSEKKKQKPQGL